ARFAPGRSGQQRTIPACRSDHGGGVPAALRAGDDTVAAYGCLRLERFGPARPAAGRRSAGTARDVCRRRTALPARLGRTRAARAVLRDLPLAASHGPNFVGVDESRRSSLI